MSKPENPTDSDLVAEFLRDRSQAAFETLYDRHSPYLFRVALRMLNGKREAAEDALQETWIRGVAAFPRFRGASALRTWLCGITINCCRETWRRKEFVSLDAAPETGAVSTEHTPALAAVRLEKAIEALDPATREIIELHCVLGHTHEEVAEILGVAVGTSKSRLFRARETLRSLLGTDMQEQERNP